MKVWGVFPLPVRQVTCTNRESQCRGRTNVPLASEKSHENLTRRVFEEVAETLNLWGLGRPAGRRAESKKTLLELKKGSKL